MEGRINMLNISRKKNNYIKWYTFLILLTLPITSLTAFSTKWWQPLGGLSIVGGMGYGVYHTQQKHGVHGSKQVILHAAQLKKRSLLAIFVKIALQDTPTNLYHIKLNHKNYYHFSPHRYNHNPSLFYYKNAGRNEL